MQPTKKKKKKERERRAKRKSDNWKKDFPLRIHVTRVKGERDGQKFSNGSRIKLLR